MASHTVAHQPVQRRPDHKSPASAARSVLVGNALRTQRLQRTVGNRALSRLLRPYPIQTKLTVSEPDDEYEREADRVADRVMRMADGESPEALSIGSVGTVQRKCACNAASGAPCECDQGAQTVQRSAEASGDVSAVPQVLRSGGHPLDRTTQGFMETSFGHDFTAVRVHTGGDAAASARSLNAHAYTSGTHIVFAANQYRPATEPGRRLLAHELTHVIQQGSTIARRLQRQCWQGSGHNYHGRSVVRDSFYA